MDVIDSTNGSSAVDRRTAREDGAARRGLHAIVVSGSAGGDTSVSGLM
jgi:hypothetical protein